MAATALVALDLGSCSALLLTSWIAAEWARVLPVCPCFDYPRSPPTSAEDSGSSSGRPRSGPGSTCRGHRENGESRGVARAYSAEKRRNIGSLRLRRSEPTRLADTLYVFCFLGKPDSEMIKLWKAESLEFREAACAIEVRVEGTSNFYSIFDSEDIEGHHVSGSMKEYLIKKRIIGNSSPKTNSTSLGRVRTHPPNKSFG